LILCLIINNVDTEYKCLFCVRGAFGHR